MNRRSLINWIIIAIMAVGAVAAVADLRVNGTRSLAEKDKARSSAIHIETFHDSDLRPEFVYKRIDLVSYLDLKPEARARLDKSDVAFFERVHPWITEWVMWKAPDGYRVTGVHVERRGS